MTRKIKDNNSVASDSSVPRDSEPGDTSTKLGVQTSQHVVEHRASAYFILTQAGSTHKMLSSMARPVEPSKLVEIDLNADPAKEATNAEQKTKKATPVVSRGARAKQVVKNAGIQVKRIIGKIGSFIATAASKIVDTCLQALSFCVKIPLLPLYLFNKVYAVTFKVDKIEQPFNVVKIEQPKSRGDVSLLLYEPDTNTLAALGSARPSAQPSPRPANESLQQQPAATGVSKSDLEEEHCSEEELRPSP